MVSSAPRQRVVSGLPQLRVLEGPRIRKPKVKNDFEDGDETRKNRKSMGLSKKKRF